MGEIWKEISGYSRYLVSSEGKVWDRENGKEVSQVLTGIPQYYYVNMRDDEGVRRLKRTHRLVAKAFCEGRTDQRNVVDHIDRNPYNNHHTNLRWVTFTGSSRNRDVSIFVSEDMTLKEWCRERFPEREDRAYSYMYRKMKIDGKSFQESVEDYEEYLRYGLNRVKVDYKGEEVYLSDLCEEKGKDLALVRDRMQRGWDAWEAIHSIPPINSYPNQLIIDYDKTGNVGMWFKSREDLRKYLGVSRELLGKRLMGLSCIEDMLDYDIRDVYRTEAHGVFGTRQEICSHFGLTLSAVETSMKRNGISFEDALLLPRQRVKRVFLNGEAMTTKDMWEYFGVNPKTASNYRSRNKVSFEETLQHYGVNTDGIEITF